LEFSVMFMLVQVLFDFFLNLRTVFRHNTSD
jgi:hypothetical protein